MLYKCSINVLYGCCINGSKIGLEHVEGSWKISPYVPIYFAVPKVSFGIVIIVFIVFQAFINPEGTFVTAMRNFE